MYYIYRIINKVNGKTYIGQRKYNGLPSADKYMGSGVILKKAQKKYGMDSFTKEIIVQEISTKEEIDSLEKYYIAKERENGKSEYNICDGGEGFTGNHSEDTKLRISNASKGNQHAKGKNLGNQNAKGNILNKETRRKMSESRKGNTNNGSATIKCIETNEIHRTREWILLGYRNAYQVAKGNREHCKGLHFEYV